MAYVRILGRQTPPAGEGPLMTEEARETLSEAQKTALSFAAVRLFTRPWFHSTIQPPPDRFLTLLLLHVYSSFMANSPMHKKEVGTAIGVEDVKTARKYVALAQELGLVEVVQSMKDRRKELLRPTVSLREKMTAELKQFDAELKKLQRQLEHSASPRVKPGLEPKIIDQRSGETSTRNIGRQRAAGVTRPSSTKGN